MEMSFRQRQSKYINDAPSLINAITGKMQSAGTIDRYFSPAEFPCITKIHGYRSAEDKDIDKDRCISFIKSVAEYDRDFCVMYISENGLINIYIATEFPIHTILSLLPGIRAETTGFPVRSFSAMKSCGVVRGRSNLYFDADKLLRHMSGKNCAVVVTFTPVSKDDLSAEREVLHNLSTVYSSLETNEIKNYKGDIRLTNPTVSLLNEILSCATDRVNEAMGTGMYTCSAFCFGENKDEMNSLVNAYISCADKKSIINDNLPDIFCGKKLIYTDIYPIKNETICVPGNDSYMMYGLKVFGRELSSEITLNEISSAVSLPVYSHAGFSVEKISKTPDEYHIFDVNIPRGKEGDTISPGIIAEGNQAFCIDINRLTSHILNCGTTGSGKSNTGRVIIGELVKNNIPVLVLESKKRDYWKFAVSRGGRVFSATNDAEALCFNPLIPQPGTVIANHIEKLIVAFSSQSTNFESPLPEVLKGLLEITYNKAGFSVDETATRREKRIYPTPKDMFSLMGEYIDSLPYSGKVKDDVYGALKMRLSELSYGMGGRIFNTDKAINFDEWFSSPVTVIELDSLEEKTCSFTVSILCCMLDEYLRSRPESHILKRMIVLEEAHRFFANTERMNASTDTKGMISAYFSEMLSTIRSYGTGMMIIDQCPSRLDGSAVANTAVKIVHALSDKKDAEAVEYHLSLSEEQKRYLTNLQTGHAVIKLSGISQCCLVKINQAESENEKPHHGCMFCEKGNCVFSAATDIFSSGRFRALCDAMSDELRDDGDIECVISLIIRCASEFYNNEMDCKKEFLTCFGGMLISKSRYANAALLRRTMKEFVRRL
ncbi:MAG: ATP-binding protein [Anaerofustis stercorihominis]|nr:ATP-binding protein [Anaerofustis stercorihominis]